MHRYIGIIVGLVHGRVTRVSDAVLDAVYARAFEAGSGEEVDGVTRVLDAVFGDDRSGPSGDETAADKMHALLDFVRAATGVAVDAPRARPTAFAHVLVACTQPAGVRADVVAAAAQRGSLYYVDRTSMMQQVMELRRIRARIARPRVLRDSPLARALTRRPE